MSPPFFSELGQKIRNVLVSGYQVSVYKVDIQKKAQNVSFNGGVTFLHETKKFGGHLGTKFTNDHFGIGIKGNAEAVHTVDEGTEEGKYVFDKTVTTEGYANDSFLKFATDYTYHSGSDDITGHLRNSFKDEFVSFTLGTEIDKDGMCMIDSSIVFEHGGFLGGCEFVVNTRNKEIIKNSVATQYTLEGFTVHGKGSTNDCIHLSCHTTLKEDFEPAASIDWNPRSGDILLTMGAKFNVTKFNVVLGAKLNSKLGMGVSYHHRINDHITFMLAAAIDCASISNYENHKVGASIQIDL